MMGIRENKTFIILLIVYFVFIASVIFSRAHQIDESTHSFSGLFIRDLIKDWLSSPTFSFGKIYNYSISYLTYYPKISLHYPPIPQVFFAVAYLFFTPSIYISRIIVALLSICFLILIYVFSNWIFKRKSIALISVLIFMTSPILIIHSVQALQEIPFILFFTLTIFLFLKAFESNNKKNYILASISMVFCILSKWQAITIVPTILFYSILFERKKMKFLIFSLVLATLILAPYYFVLYKTGLFWVPLKANVPSLGSPKWYQVEGLTYYIKALLFEQFFFPVGATLLITTILYVKNKRKNWNLFLIWIIISFAMMTFFIENKNPKYTINVLPAFVIPSSFLIHSFLKKINRKIGIGLFLFLILSQFFFTLGMIPKGFEDVEEIGKYAAYNSKGNILVNSMLGSASPFIFEIAKVSNFSHQVFRPCLIEEYNESFDYILENFSIEYVIEEKNLNYLTERQKEFFDYLTTSGGFVKEKEYKSFLLFRRIDFSPITQEKICNYICATKEFVCSSPKRPSEFLR